MDEHNRTSNRVPASVEVSMSSENTFWTGITDNISEGGVFVATHQAPPVGTEVELALSLPETEQSFVVRGVVRWLRPFEASCEGMPTGCGLQFVKIAPEALSAIKQFVEQRGTLFYEAA